MGRNAILSSKKTGAAEAGTSNNALTGHLESAGARLTVDIIASPSDFHIPTAHGFLNGGR